MENKIIQGDCLEVLKTLPDNSIDAIVTDPPYELGFMGKKWDNSGIAYNINLWKEVLRILKPGGFLLSFGGTRTYHRMTCAIEDAGFEIRDCIQWLYGSGFPKSLNIGKSIDKIQGNEREVVGETSVVGMYKQEYQVKQGYRPENNSGGYKGEREGTSITKGNTEWEGWGTSVKPSNEPVVVAQKPLNTLTHINILCRLIGYVKDVERSLKLKVVGLKEEKEITAQENVLIQQEEEKENLMEIGKVEDLKEVMDTLQFSQKEVNTNLNTILLWKNLLEEIYREMNRFTTSMEKEMITELKILNSLLYQNIQNFIIKEESQANGNQSNVLLVENLLKGLLVKLRSINLISVQENVTKKELNLSPNCNPICMARKPLSEKNVALNVLKWGTGGINIDACRIGNEILKEHKSGNIPNDRGQWGLKEGYKMPERQGRFPANIILEKSYQQVYILKESFINLIPLLNLYYGNEYMFKLQEEISNLQMQNEGQSWKVLSEEMLSPMDEGKEKSNGWKETQQKINSKDDRISQEYPKGEKQQEIQRVLDEQGVQISQQRRINCTTEDISKSNDKEMRDTRTQDSNGNTSEKTLKEMGDSSSQEWNKERQQNREFGNDEQLNTQERTQRDFKRIKAVTKGERGFIVCDCDLPNEWKEYFESTIIEIDYPFSSGKMLDEQAPQTGAFAQVKSGQKGFGGVIYGKYKTSGDDGKTFYNEKLQGASRFFYCAKTSKKERNFGCEDFEKKTTDDGRTIVSDRPHQIGATNRKNNHPTVKPIKLMEYLIKLVSREGAVVLDPFLGSGTTGCACVKLNRNFIGIEKEEEYIKIAEARINAWKIKGRQMTL